MKYFNNKSEYLAYRKAWGEASNDKRAKAFTATHDEYLWKEKGEIKDMNTTQDGAYYVSKGTGVHKETGWITATHCLLNNLLLEKQLNRGFNAITNKHKLKNVGDASWYFYYNVEQLAEIVNRAKKIVIDSNTIKLAEPKRVAGINKAFAEEWSAWRDNRSKEQLFNSTRKYYLDNLNYFLKPLNNTININKLASIDIKDLEKYLLFNKIKQA